MGLDADDLVAMFAEHRARIGSPSLQVILKRFTRIGLTAPSRSTLSDAFTGRKIPRGELAKNIMAALGADEDTQHRARRLAESAAARRAAARAAMGVPMRPMQPRDARVLDAGQPVRLGIVPRPADPFLRREPFEQLSAATNLAALTSIAPYVLSGISGAGKTQLAADLAERLWSSGALDLLLWVPASSPHEIVAAYSRAATRVGVPHADAADSEQDAERFLAWLAETNRRWLIVLDDVSRTADLQGRWPPQHSSGRTVVTTQLRGAALRGSGYRALSVDGFTVGEASAYVRNQLNSAPYLADDVEGLTAALGRLPLALSQATAFILDDDLRCSDYRERLADRRRMLDDLVPAATDLPGDYARTVAAALSLAVENADRSRPTGLATALLRLLSVLDPSGVPITMFDTVAARNWLGHHHSARQDRPKSPAINRETIHSGLRALHRLHLATVEADQISVHRLVQRAVRERLSEPDLADIVWAVADALLTADASGEAAVEHGLLSNAMTLVAHHPETLLTPEPHPILVQTYNALGATGQYVAAWSACDRLLAEVLRVFGPGEFAATVARSSAHWRGEAGDSSGAVADLEQLLVDAQQWPATVRPDMFEIRASLATERLRAGDAARAVMELKSLLAEWLVDHNDDPMTLTLRHNLALGWRLDDDLQQATATYERLVDDMTRVHGPEHPNTLATVFNLADCCASAGASVRARELYERLLPVYRRLAGEDHVNTLKVRRGLIEHGAGVCGESYEDLLDDMRRVLGATHPETLAVRRAVAIRRAETEELKDLLDDHLQTLGARHADTMRVREHLAYALGDSGRHRAALAEFERLLADQLEVLGPANPETLKTRHNLLLRRGGPGAACQRPELLALLDDQTRELGRDHPYTLVTRGSLGMCHLMDGEPAAAAAIFEDLLADEQRVLGPDHHQTVGTRHNLAVAKG